MLDLKNYGYIETETPSNGLLVGRIIEFRRDRYTVITERGEVTAVLKGTFIYDAEIRADLPCVGDFVFLQYNEHGDSRITKLLTRRSKFSRSDFSGHGYAHIKANREQVLAANFDFIFIVTSLNRDFNVNRILRYLTQARQSGGQPVIILTKADLLNGYTPQLNDVKAIAPYVPVHAISSHTGYGMDALNEYLQPSKTVIFLGMSGVGKSSLLNALANENIMLVRQTRNVDAAKGSHTTTHRQLFMLPSGAMVIDTPGMRTLGIIDAEDAIGANFSDVEELFSQCRFNDCRHETEPGCAVTAAINDGSLSQKRFEQYLTQKRENKFTDDKANFIREKSARNKEIAMFTKHLKKRR
jgi:ribosome biogenesis GTPase